MADAHDVPLKLHNESIIDSGLVIHPFTRLGEETFLSGPLIKEHGIEKHLETIRTLKTKDTDILLCTSMKSGTHWCHEILSMLLYHTTEYNSKGVLHHMLVDLTAHVFDKLDDVEDPRLFTTHLPLHHLPIHHSKLLPLKIMLQFVCLFINKKGTFTEEPSQTCFTIGQHPFSTIKKMAEFINVSHTDDFIREIIEKCSFDNIKKHKYDSSRIIDPKNESTLFRKGVIGDWTNWFTVAQNEKFDEIYKGEMKSCDVEFIYEQ